MTPRFDVTSVGATMLRLSVPPGERLESAGTYDVRTAGSESNTLVALARLGKRTAWASRLTDNPIGRRIDGDLRRFGVDTSRVAWTHEDRNELFFVEFGAQPRPTQVIYDRRHSAVSKLRLAELDTAYLLDTRLLHLSGILPALSPACARASAELLRLAHAAGIATAFDVNYRARLWSSAAAHRVLAPLLNGVTLLFCTAEDARDLFGLDGEPTTVARALRKRFGARAVILTLGAAGGVAWDGRRMHRVSGYPVEPVDRLGAGDCFAAGVLCGWLEGSLAQGMAYGAAMAAIKLGIKGDYFLSDRQEVDRLLAATAAREVRR